MLAWTRSAFVLRTGAPCLGSRCRACPPRPRNRPLLRRPCCLRCPGRRLPAHRSCFRARLHRRLRHRWLRQCLCRRRCSRQPHRPRRFPPNRRQTARQPSRSGPRPANRSLRQRGSTHGQSKQRGPTLRRARERRRCLRWRLACSGGSLESSRRAFLDRWETPRLAITSPLYICALPATLDVTRTLGVLA